MTGCTLMVTEMGVELTICESGSSGFKSVTRAEKVTTPLKSRREETKRTVAGQIQLTGNRSTRRHQRPNANVRGNDGDRITLWIDHALQQSVIIGCGGQRSVAIQSLQHNVFFDGVSSDWLAPTPIVGGPPGKILTM